MSRIWSVFLIGTFSCLFTPRFGVATAQVPDQTGIVLDNPLAVHTLDRLSVTRERPVFSPSRRPPPPPPQPIVQLPSPPPPPAPPSLTLFGIVLEAGEARAVVRIAPRGEIVRVRIGEEINGWKVTQIERRQLVLSLEGRSVTFTLFGGQGPKPPIGGPASPAVNPPQRPIQPQSLIPVRDPGLYRR
jgi:type II secretory pathway component PulC